MDEYLNSNKYFYFAHEAQRGIMQPLNFAAHLGKTFLNSEMNPLGEEPTSKRLAATFELMERTTRRYEKPDFGITATRIGDTDKTCRVYQKVVKKKTFCDLIHFRKDVKNPGPTLLVVAPLSGHFATLLRGTVEGLLPYFDVYITDWMNVRDIPLSKGTFDLDDYTNYVIEFIEAIEGDVHVMGVCQPAVPVMMATAIQHYVKGKTPKSMTLIGGPIDTRESPTEVNELAKKHDIDWFDQTVVSIVPFNYPGFMRRVYPGFLQLSSFMQMNADRHMSAHMDFFGHLVEGDGDGAKAHKKFYNEYLSVMDLPAEFYLQTVEHVFQTHSLPKGIMVSRDRPVRPDLITDTALLCIEGERDDISGAGQTKAALKICSGIPAAKKKNHLQKGVGHYGTFNGRRFREQIVPVIREFIAKA